MEKVSLQHFYHDCDCSVRYRPSLPTTRGCDAPCRWACQGPDPSAPIDPLGPVPWVSVYGPWVPLLQRRPSVGRPGLLRRNGTRRGGGPPQRPRFRQYTPWLFPDPRPLRSTMLLAATVRLRRAAPHSPVALVVWRALSSTRVSLLGRRLARLSVVTPRTQHPPGLEAAPIPCFHLPGRPVRPCTTTTTGTTADNHIHNNTLPPSPTADELYESYQLARHELEELRHTRERTKSEHLYEAWRRADEASSQRRASAGVAVVKTLVQQTRNEQERHQEMETKLQQRAQAFLEEAARQGHGQALVQLGNQALQRAHESWKDGRLERTQEALEEAMQLYRKSLSPEGWFNLGNLLWSGYPDQTEDGPKIAEIVLKADKRQSMEAFEEAIALGDADAMYFVGVQELGSEDRDGDEAATLETLRRGLGRIERAACQGHGGALYYLALFHLNGHATLGIPPCSSEDFVTRLNAATGSGNADALFLRGHCYYNGDHGYSHDIRKALDDFLQAADGGNADAAISAGAILFHGHPPTIPRQRERAFALYQHAGELGSVEGWRNVVACYATGEGVARNEQVAKYIAETMLKEDSTEKPTGRAPT